MQEQLKSIILDIESKTGKAVVIYDFLGGVIAKAESVDEGYSFKALALDAFSDGIYKDENSGNTYFIVNVNYMSQPLFGVIRGTDKNTGDFAFMISAIIENAFRHFDSEPSVSDAFASVLLGNANTIEIKRIKEKYGIENGLYYVYAIGVNREKVGEIMNFLASFSTSDKDIFVVLENEVLAYVKHVNQEEESFGANEFAVMLAENIRTELSLNVSICSGPNAMGIHEFRESYAQAVGGLRMGKYFNYADRVYSYKEFLMVGILEELPRKVIENFKRRNLNPETVAVFEDTDLTLTAEVFMNHSLNISETARSLYVHRNTLMYRLDKIERDTGLNIRVFSDAVTFRILEILYKMNENAK